MDRYNCYHKHDHRSNLFGGIDSNTHPEEYIQRYLDLDCKNYFTTQHGWTGDIFTDYRLCKQAGLNCIVGMEGYIVPDVSDKKDKSNYHIIVIPKNEGGRKRLNIMSSNANVDYFYYKPRLSLQDLLESNPDDFYITTACVAGLLRDETSIEKIFKPLAEHFGKNLFLEVQAHQPDIQKEINRKAIKYSEDLGLGLIAATDSHYIDERGRKERDLLMKGKGISYPEEDSFNLDFPDIDTLYSRFVEQGVLTKEQIVSAINNTLVFDDCEPLVLNYDIKMPTIDPDLTPEQRYEKLEKMVWERFDTIRKDEHIEGQDLQNHIDGIKYELNTIKETNEVAHMADYFLFNTRLVDLAVNKYGGILTRTGRGSCGAFYVNRILGMTQLDRFHIGYKLYPDRFISTARVIENRSLADIDMNVVSQKPFQDAAKELLGEHSCYPMYALGTMKISEAFRNLCRAKGLEYSEYNEVAKDVDAYREDKKWKPIIEEAEHFVGTIISASVHPCSHLIMQEDIREELGVIRLGEFIVAPITSGEADEYKYLKDDLLIVSVWKLISETFKKIGQPILSLPKLLEKVKNDDRIWNLLADGITATLNQVDSDNGRQQCMKYKPRSFEECGMLAAAIRPSFDSWREDFLNRKEYDFGSPTVNALFSTTHGYDIFQENNMQFFEHFGISPAESIGLIKKISKKKIKPEDFEKLKGRVYDNWVKEIGNDKDFNKTWENLQSALSYGFAAPHASACSGDMLYGAYLKVNYPLEYYTVCLNNYADDEKETAKITAELPYFGIKLGGVKFRFSGSEYQENKDTKTIYKGLASIKSIGMKTGDDLLQFKDFQGDFASLLAAIRESKAAKKNELEILIKIGFFSEFGCCNKLLYIKQLFETFYGKKNLKKSKAEELGLDPQYLASISQKETKTQYMGIDMLAMIRHLAETANIPEESIMQRALWESELLGYISITEPSMDGRYNIVTAVNDRPNKPIISLYCLKNGKNYQMRCKRSRWRDKSIKTTWKDLPLQKNDVVLLKGWKKEPKPIKVGDEWKDSDELQWILTDYSVLSSRSNKESK